MFGLFKKKPIEVKFDYEFSSRVASTLEGFLISCASNWENPSEKLKEYSMHVSPHGNISIQLNEHEKASDDSLYVISFDQISGINSINSTLIDMTMPGPFVNPLISMVSDEIVKFMMKEKG